MKILFVTKGNSVDYLNDTIFIGLVNNGNEVVDSNYLWHISRELSDEEKLNTYGFAFSIGNVLPDRSNIDRNNIVEKIKSHYFDIVVYGSIERCRDYFDIVTDVYKPNEVIFINGDDEPYYDKTLENKGIVFQRENLTSFNGCLPISFSLPRCKFYTGTGILKSKFYAEVMPHQKNYLYINENDYYEDYRTSFFGITMRKFGWDCLRHYEIIGNQCLPYFVDYDQKPPYIMVNWPSELQKEANYLYFNFKAPQDREFNNYWSKYCKVVDEFFTYAYNNLTCEKNAEYILSKIY